VAFPAHWTDRSSAYFLISSAHQLLAQRFLGQIAHRLTASFLPLVDGSPDGSSDGSLIGLLPCSFHSSVACPARRMERSSAYLVVSSARQWLVQLAGQIAHRLTSSFLPLISCLPDGSSGGSLVSLLPLFFRLSAARPTVPRTDHSSAYFLVPSAHQWLAQLARQIAHRFTSSFLPVISGYPGSPDRSLIGLLPHFFRSSVACLTVPQAERSSAYCLFSSACRRLARWFLGRITHRLTSSFLPLISGLPGSPDRLLIGLLPRSFHSSVACPARRTDHSLTYFLVPSTRQWLSWLTGWIAYRLISSFLPLVGGWPDGSHIGLLPRFFRASVARPTVPRTDHSSAYFLVSSACQWLAGRVAHQLTSSYLLLVSSSPDGSLVG